MSAKSYASDPGLHLKPLLYSSNFVLACATHSCFLFVFTLKPVFGVPSPRVESYKIPVQSCA